MEEFSTGDSIKLRFSYREGFLKFFLHRQDKIAGSRAVQDAIEKIPPSQMSFLNEIPFRKKGNCYVIVLPLHYLAGHNSLATEYTTSPLLPFPVDIKASSHSM